MNKEETTADKSRRERRKESRLAKNASKHQSWLRHHEKSRALKRSNNNSELKTESKLDQSVSPTINETRVMKLESSSAKAKHEAVEECTMSGEIGGSVGRKKKKDSHRSSKKRRVDMGMTEVSMAAQKDLEFERKLYKKLKVKEGKLRGMDDGLNVLLDGMSSFADLLGESEVPGNDELPKKRSKKSSLSKKHKLPKEGMKAESLDGELGPVETSDQDVASEEVPDSVTSKKHKKRKLSSQERGDNVEDGNVCTANPVESSGIDVTSEDVPVEVPMKKDNEKYIAPQLRARAGNEPEEHTQIRRRVRGLINKISESNVESITGDLSSIFQARPL